MGEQWVVGSPKSHAIAKIWEIFSPYIKDGFDPDSIVGSFIDIEIEEVLDRFLEASERSS